MPFKQPAPNGTFPNAHGRKSGEKMQVLVRDNNIEQALRVLKKKLQREGVFREMKARRAYEKPSEKRVRQKAEAIRRSRKLARKQAQRDGLLPAPKRKESVARPRSRA
jgi:small subunit ribosomal protein S21